MNFDQKRQTSIDDLLNDLLRDGSSLRQIFTNRLEELKLSFTATAELLDIQSRTLKGILDGTQKSVDITNIITLANFLQINKEEVFQLYIRAISKNYELEPKIEPEKAKFIKENFDLAGLKGSNFIDDISDYSSIEIKLTTHLGLDKITDYKPISEEVAFSSSKIKPKNELNRNLWVFNACQIFKEISNPNEYDRKGLIDYFPEIRWHSTNVDLGLINVIRELYKLGITVIFSPSLKSLHLRGATFSVNRKPCIAITDYRNFYATLWYTLIHELFHVIFDWEEIKRHRFHISDEDTEQLSVIEKEVEADEFARKYLFSKEKSKIIRPRINDRQHVADFAKVHQVHPNIIYTFNAYDVGKTNRSAWALARKENPDTKKLLDPINNGWSNPKPVAEYVRIIRKKLYN